MHIDDEDTARIAKASVESADYVEMSGIEAESGLTQSWTSTKLLYCEPSYMHVRPGQCTNAMPKDLILSI